MKASVEGTAAPRDAADRWPHPSHGRRSVRLVRDEACPSPAFERPDEGACTCTSMPNGRAPTDRSPDSGLRTSPPPSRSHDQWHLGGLLPDTVALPSPILTGFPYIHRMLFDHGPRRGTEIFPRPRADIQRTSLRYRPERPKTSGKTERLEFHGAAHAQGDSSKAKARLRLDRAAPSILVPRSRPVGSGGSHPYWTLTR